MVQSGDFIGFTYNGYKSRDIGVVRVSNSDRYSNNVLPSFEDKVADIPGGDGQYFYGTYFKAKEFSMSIAFDSLSEDQLQQLSIIFGDRQVHDLIFDEWPYKVYSAKVKSEPELSYICFDELNQRVYKGEGTINFICYYPFAHSYRKFLEGYGNDNMGDWAVQSRMKEQKQVNKEVLLDTYNSMNGHIELFNAGDLNTDFKLFIPFVDNKIDGFSLKIFKRGNNSLVLGDKSVVISNGDISKDLKYYTQNGEKITPNEEYYYQDKTTGKRYEWNTTKALFDLVITVPVATIKFDTITAKDSSETGIVVDSALQALRGYKKSGENITYTMNLYNNELLEGSFFQIPKLDSELQIISNSDTVLSQNITIQYNYLYY